MSKVSVRSIKADIANLSNSQLEYLFSYIVEMDECFFLESFKGNHRKSGFVMPRPDRKRGKQVKQHNP